MIEVIPDSQKTHWVNRTPESIRPYLQLSRLDRPVGYWLLTLPGWIGLAFAGLSHGLVWEDLKWALLILIGAIAMRGAGCTYNDIVDQDLDAQVERTALRPLPAGTVTNKQAWIWLFMQCGIGFIVLLCLPRLAQIVSLCSIPLVAAYPFMKRITWWPQIWLGLTFNWAVLVAYTAKTGSFSPDLFVLFTGLIFWTVGYDTIYACQDIEDDAFVGIKSTARKFGNHIKIGVAICYSIAVLMVWVSIFISYSKKSDIPAEGNYSVDISPIILAVVYLLPALIFAGHLVWQIFKFRSDNSRMSLKIFKSNFWAAIFLILPMLSFAYHE